MRYRVYILGFLIALLPSVVGGFGVALLWEYQLQRNGVLAYQEGETGTTNQHLTSGYRWLRRMLDQASDNWYDGWPSAPAVRMMGANAPPWVTLFWARADALLRAGERSLPGALLAAFVLAGGIVERVAMFRARRAGRSFVPLPVGGWLRARSYLVSRLRGALLATVVVGMVSAGAPILIGPSYLHNLAGGVVWLSAMVALGFACVIAGGAWRCFPMAWSPGDLWTCSRCRYQVGATFPARCPECGLTSGGVPRRRGLPVFPARWRPYAVILALSAVVVVVHWAVVTPPKRSVVRILLPHDRPSELVWSNGIRARIVPPRAASPGTAVWKCVWSDEHGDRFTQTTDRSIAVFQGPRGCEIEWYRGDKMDTAVVSGRLVKIERTPTGDRAPW